MSTYEPVIGLEVHCQLLTKSKLFCGCSTAYGAPPNHHTCPVCLGHPGVLPVMNEEVLRFALRIGEALGCTIRETSVFARKNYFYPDLPKGYQVSQYEAPLCEGGHVDVGEKRFGLTRIHIEEDAGKSVHVEGENVSQVDFNRTGVPLIEIVSAPDLRSSDEASDYLKELRNVVRYLGISDGHMEQGSFRCDANVSIRRSSADPFGTRVELKNLNSFNHVKRAIDYELARQAEVLDSGAAVVQETRLWDEKSGRSRSMRGKEDAHDYRYFPEPDLLPLMVPKAMWDEVKATLPELPRQRRARYVRDLGLGDYDADVLTSDKALSDYFEAVVATGAEAKSAANWVTGELRGRLNADGKQIEQSPASPQALGAILGRLAAGRISGKIAKDVFARAYAGEDVAAVLDAAGEQTSDTSLIEAAVKDVLDANAGEVAKYLDGKTKIFGFFVGKVMAATKGKANPSAVNELLTKALDERREWH